MHIVQGEMDLMDLAYNEAKTKAIKIANEKGRSKCPWLEHPVEFLTIRLNEEIAEWRERYDPDELLDIIDFAIFLYLNEKGWPIPEQDAEKENTRFISPPGLGVINWCPTCKNNIMTDHAELKDNKWTIKLKCGHVIKWGLEMNKEEILKIVNTRLGTEKQDLIKIFSDKLANVIGDMEMQGHEEETILDKVKDILTFGSTDIYQY